MSDDRPEIPRDVSKLTYGELVALETELMERFNALREAEPSNEITDELAAIAEILPQAGERIDAMEAARNEAASGVEEYARARAEARAEKVDTPAEPAEPEPTPDADAAEPTDTPKSPAEETAIPDEATEPIDEAPENIDIDTSESDKKDDEDDEKEDAAVSASATPPEPRRTVAEIAANAPVTVAPNSRANGGQWFQSLTAGSEIPGMSAAARFSSGAEIADAFIRRTEAIQVREGSREALVATAHVEGLGDPLTWHDGAASATTKMMEALSRYRENRDRQALTASGWCAPSETLYDLCEPEVADQLVSLPEIAIGRGGIQFFPTPDMSAFDPFLWGYCEEELKEGVQKPCPEIPCPDPIEERACVEGACAQASILMAKAFPEWVERYVRGILVAHAVRISAVTLARMEAGSTPIVYDCESLEGSGFTADLLNAIEVQAEDLRADYMLGMGDRIEVILPRWARSAIRADLSNRMGVDMISVTNQFIDRVLAERGVMVQWVKGWQEDGIGVPATNFAYPATVRFLIYREGAWVRGLEPVIELSTMYDSTLIAKNKYSRIFTEQALMIANLCTNSRVVEIPVCPSGATNAGRQIQCFSDAACDGGEGVNP